MNRKLLWTLAGVLSSTLFISSAHAASGLYLGAGLGQSSVKDDTGSGSFDASDAAYKVFAGYRFNMIPIIDLAAEVGYNDFGKPSQDVGGQRVQFKLHGFDAAGLLIFPPGPVDFYGKVGERLVWLCWKFGETRIDHYHQLDEGFSGRKRIEESGRRILLN